MDCSKYLGVLIGPHADATSNYNIVFNKFKNACYFWLLQKQTGNFFQTFAYNTYGLPILGFIAMFYPPPVAILKEIEHLALLFAHGPRHWLCGSPFFRAKKDLGLYTCRCGQAHLLSVFFKSCGQFMFDYQTRVRNLNDLCSLRRCSTKRL